MTKQTRNEDEKRKNDDDDGNMVRCVSLSTAIEIRLQLKETARSVYIHREKVAVTQQCFGVVVDSHDRAS
jgi:hypothetical protein